MPITIRIVGPLRFIVGREVVIHQEHATLKDVLDALENLYREKAGVGRPPFKELLKQLSIFVNNERVDIDADLTVSSEDDIKIVQPVHGG